MTVSEGNCHRFFDQTKSRGFPRLFFASRGQDHDFPAVVLFEVEMRLKSADQPGVRSLFCAKQANVMGPLFLTNQYPTLTEIRNTLANAIEIIPSQ